MDGVDAVALCGLRELPAMIEAAANSAGVADSAGVAGTGAGTGAGEAVNGSTGAAVPAGAEPICTRIS